MFTTAVFLPLALIGVGLTIFRKRTAVLIILAVVPLYYFTVQSAFHTEYRYVLAVNYFLFAFAAVAIAWCSQVCLSQDENLSPRERAGVRAYAFRYLIQLRRGVASRRKIILRFVTR